MSGADGGQPAERGTRSDVAALVLAAGAGSRLAPLTRLRPKPLCPVLDRTLLDRSLGRIADLDPDAALQVVVNTHHGAAAVVAHLAGRGSLAGAVSADGGVAPVDPSAEGVEAAHATAERTGDPSPVGRPPGPGEDRRAVLVSIERERALGTAGAVGRLAPWLDGRGLLVLNGDTFTDLSLGPLLGGWDGVRHRVLVVGEPDLGPSARVAGALVPWSAARSLPPEPGGLWERCWRDALADGSLEVVGGRGTFVDCGTPGSYLRANLVALDAAVARDLATGELGRPERGAGVEGGSWVGHDAEVVGDAVRCVVGAGATVRGTVVDSVLWPGAVVEAGEHLVGAIRTAPAERTGRALTVLAR